jgi:hypothetical protein
MCGTTKTLKKLNIYLLLIKSVRMILKKEENVLNRI